MSSIRFPYADADRSLRSLAFSAEGFGAQASGGRDGPIFTVNTLADSGPGSLREACDKNGPLWIIFSVSGTISLPTAIRVRSDKAINGRGQKVILKGAGLHLKSCENVIVCNLILEGGRGHDADGVKIKPASKNIWIDRCTLADFDDGLIDITRGSSHITISRCHFLRHDKTMLIGADPTHVEDRNTLVTVHHCFFDGTRQRHPRVRFAKVHLYNNYTRHWGIYAVCASIESQILSEGNIYEAGLKKKVFEYYFEKAPLAIAEQSGLICSKNDLFLGSSEVDVRDKGFSFDPLVLYSKLGNHAQPTLCRPTLENVGEITKRAGWQDMSLPLE